MNKYARAFFILAGLTMVFLLSDCHLPGGTATPTATDTDIPVEGEVVFELGPGTRVAWIDRSHVVYVPEGEFIMGKDEELVSDHAPAHTVSLGDFWIHQTEVTNQMYAGCVAAGLCTLPDQEADGPYYDIQYSNHPVVNVDWNQAETYCEWILGRLPSEAEWEKAARGDGGDPYPWGEETPDCGMLNADECLDPADTAPVRTYGGGASPYDLADTAGNVFEWVQDWYDETYYASSPAADPTGPAVGEERVFRGSSFQTPADELAIYLRNSLDPYEGQDDLGFRCILSGETVANPPPPVCEVAGYIPPDEGTDGGTPDSHTTNTYCIESGEGVIMQVEFEFDHPVSAADYTVTSPLGIVSCLVNPTLPNILMCSGPGLPLGNTVDVTICSPLTEIPEDMTPSCPAGYYWNDLARRCRSNLLPPLEADCGPDGYQTDVYGCVPLATGPFDDECPIGFGLGLTFTETDEIFLCLPIDGEAYCEENAYCSRNQTCTIGTYIPEEDCCDPPEDVLPTCEVGYHYDMFVGVCKWEGSEETSCVTERVTLPACPTPELPPPEQNIPCSSYTDFNSCISDPDCRWLPSMSVPGGGRCTDRP